MGGPALLALVLAAGPLDAVLTKVFDAYGGEPALAKVRAVRETGTLSSARGDAKLLRAFEGGDKLRVEMRYPGGGGETRVLDGLRGWRDNEPVQGPPRDAMILQLARLDLPGILLRNRGKLVDLGPVDRDGKKLQGIGCPLPNGLSLAVAVDPATGLILRSEGALPVGVRFATSYSDFRKVNGVLFAFTEENFAGGQHTGKTRLEKVELLETLPPGTWPKAN